MMNDVPKLEQPAETAETAEIFPSLQSRREEIISRHGPRLLPLLLALMIWALGAVLKSEATELQGELVALQQALEKQQAITHQAVTNQQLLRRAVSSAILMDRSRSLSTETRLLAQQDEGLHMELDTQRRRLELWWDGFRVRSIRLKQDFTPSPGAHELRWERKQGRLSTDSGYEIPIPDFEAGALYWLLRKDMTLYVY